MRLFCFGFGFCASYFARGTAWESIDGTHRGDLPLNEEMKDKLAGATHILHSIPPNIDGDMVESYKNNAKWFGYLSTTGVYGNTDGAWVDETSRLKPVNDRSQWRVDAEAKWQARGANIFRLSGIYGPGRSVINDLQEGTARRIYKENQFFSRIHVEDITQVLVASLDKQGEIYNCADDYPCSAAEVVEYAAQLMGLEPPPLIPYEEAEMSEMARSFYTSSRRVRNNKIKQNLKVKLKYPTYKEGLSAIWHSSR